MAARQGIVGVGVWQIRLQVALGSASNLLGVLYIIVTMSKLTVLHRENTEETPSPWGVRTEDRGVGGSVGARRRPHCHSRPGLSQSEPRLPFALSPECMDRQAK
ncbi:hypothetical protein CALCODRAFT_329509 [Calocera cornea HHB12733]|uniref:Uncharacterized protein n=1 Tax=Calocera cornea HHB12733 TaxID=1353952 RepID=A0A165JJC5_9BASI|nr:hypothetical protein CALCODRAFT_329509 [Calocera cornea HHB12733]